MTKDEGTIVICKEAIEQPAQDPVAWRVLLDEAPQDTYWHYMTGRCPQCFKSSAEPLYTHPHQWQGLTDDEINQVCLELFETPAMQGDLEFGYAIEQALRIKNEC